MSAVDYEYRGLLASTWDLLRGDTSQWPDRSFYLELIRRSGEPVLDVGCGTGRLLLDYRAQGIDIDGVDLSPEMLTLCRAKAAAAGLGVSLFEQAMETLDLPRRYRTIIVPSSSFQLVLDPAHALQTMRRFHAHLERAGTLAMPFMLLWTPGDPEHTEWKAWRELTRPEDGATVRRWSRADYDVAAQLEHTEDRFEVSLDGAVIAREDHRRSPATRWYTQERAFALYGAAGFVDCMAFKGFTQDAAGVDDDIFTLAGVRP